MQSIFRDDDGKRYGYPKPMAAFLYIMASRRNGTLYTGVSSNLPKRVYDHREGLIEGFTKTHGCKQLVYFEAHATMPLAIEREKRVKKWRREWKLKLIEEHNPEWRDLFDDISK